MKIVAVCVSSSPKMFPGRIAFTNSVNWSPAPPRRTIARVAFIARERNLAIQKALTIHSDMTHVLMLDSWYLDNPANDKEWDRFVESYHDPDIILGAATYETRDTRLFLEPITFFVEIATILEAADSTMNVEGKTGRIRVQAVGSVYIFPVEIWQKHPYQARTDYFLPEHVDLCRRSNLPVYLSFDHRFYKKPVKYGLWKKMRVAAGYEMRKIVHA